MAENAPVISVLMPVFNVEHYIRQAVSSILDQTFSDWEFIIIDDASADGTWAILETYQDPRIRLVRNEMNIKLAASLNKGLHMVKGKYIVRMDGDDISRPDRLRKLYDHMESHPEVDVCGSAMKVFGKEETTWYYPVSDKAVRAALVWTSAMGHGSVIMRTSSVQKKGLKYDESFSVGQDWKFWFDIKDKVVFANLEDPLYLYRRDEHSVTLRSSDRSSERYAVMHDLLLSDIGLMHGSREVLLHQFILGMFFKITPSPAIIREARNWYDRLLQHVKKSNKIDYISFRSVSEKHWNSLFYKLLPFGFSTVMSYWQSTGIRIEQLKYYLIYLIKGK